MSERLDVLFYFHFFLSVLPPQNHVTSLTSMTCWFRNISLGYKSFDKEVSEAVLTDKLFQYHHPLPVLPLIH